MNIRSTKREFLSKLPVLLSTIAVIAISWKLLSFFDKMTKWWALPLLAILAGVSAMLLPKIARKFPVVNALIATGTTLLVFHLLWWIPKEWTFFIEVAIISAIGIITDIFVSPRISLGDVLFDVAASASGAVVIDFLKSIPITTVLLIVIFTIILKFRFSYKEKHTSEE